MVGVFSSKKKKNLATEQLNWYEKSYYIAVERAEFWGREIILMTVLVPKLISKVKGEIFQSTSFRLVYCKPVKHAGRWLVLIFWSCKSAKEE